MGLQIHRGEVFKQTAHSLKFNLTRKSASTHEKRMEKLSFQTIETIGRRGKHVAE